jgi:hypothetical protein
MRFGHGMCVCVSGSLVGCLGEAGFSGVEEEVGGTGCAVVYFF